MPSIASIAEKAIANWCESAQPLPMSKHGDTPLRSNAGHQGMITRSRRQTINFKYPFRLKGIDRLLSPGAYEVITDEEMIEGLSFPCFRRVATMIVVPGEAPRTSSLEMISISSADLLEAQRIDGSRSS